MLINISNLDLLTIHCIQEQLVGEYGCQGKIYVESFTPCKVFIEIPN